MLHETARQAATGGVSPFDAAAAQDFDKIREDVQVYDEDSIGGVTVKRIPGRPPSPHDPLHDPSAVVLDSHGPGLGVTITHQRRSP